MLPENSSDMATKSQLYSKLAAAEARLAKFEARDAIRISDPLFGERLFREHLDIGLQEQESFMVAVLDARQKPLAVTTVAVGSLSQVDTHPREVFKEAVRIAGHSIIMAHNHPSGDYGPSESDIELTDRMVLAGQILGIPILDHLILTKDGAFSFAAKRLLKGEES